MRIRVKALGLLLGCCMALAAFAGEKATVKGYLVDKLCASAHASEGENFGKVHKRECALKPWCVKGGYGVLAADTQFYKFDEAGDKKALEALKATSKADNLQVTVTGEKDGDSLKVASLRLE